MTKTDMKFKKIFKQNNSNNNAHLNFKKNKKIEKEEGIKSLMVLKQNENPKNSELLKSNKKKTIFDKKKLDTFRSIEYLTNFNSISHNYKNTLNTLNVKGKKSYGKSQIINTERIKTVK